jgi:hypothetical protein
MVISYNFPATASNTPQDTIISTAAITVATPVTGNAVNRIATGEAGYTCSTVTWSPNDTTFRAGTRYTATITLTATAGNTFDNTATVTVNGETARIVRNTGTSLILSYTFAATSNN